MIGDRIRWKVRARELRAARAAAGLTRKALSERTGLHPATIKRLERADRYVISATAETLARELGAATVTAEPQPVPGRVLASRGRSSILTAQFERWLSERRLAAPSTVRTYERALRRLELHAGVPRDELTRAHLGAFLRDCSIGAAVREQTFIAFRIWHRWGAGEGFWSLDRELEVQKLPKARHGPLPALERADAAALLSAARTPAEKRLAFLGLYQGLRLAEIEAVDADAWLPSLLSVRVKGDWIHRIPIHPELSRHREEILSERPGRRQLQRACERLRSVVAMPITPHWLRRTYSQALVGAGVHREVVGALLGHAPSTITTAHYAPVTWSEMVGALARLSYDSPSPKTA